MNIHTKLTREDALAMLEIAEQMHKESPNFQNKPFDRERIWKLFDATVKYPSRFCMIYAKDGDKPIGGILGKITEQYFSGDLVASDFGMFILPEHRGGSCFVRLFKEFEKWSIDNGATSIMVGHTTGVNTENAQGMFLRLGYSLMGYVFNKELQNVYRS